MIFILRANAAIAAFTLIELLIAITIIAVLGSLLIPTISLIQEKAYRTNCMSNLRQIGMGDVMYSGDNDDRLMLRDTGHIQGANKLAGQHNNSNSFNRSDFSLTQYIPAKVWFCPRYYQSFNSGQPGKRPGTRFTDDEKRAAVNNNQFGYAFHRSSWESVNGVIGYHPFSPGENGYGDQYGGESNGMVTTEAALSPKAVRMGEFYVNRTDLAGFDNNAQNDAKFTGWWHLGKGGVPEGGNVIYGDLSAGWSKNFLDFGGISFVGPKN